MIEHPLDLSAPVRYRELRAALTAALGRPVEILTSEPPDGPGTLIVTDPVTDERLDVDPTVVAAAVGEVAAAPAARSAVREVREAMAAAVTPAAKLAAVEAFFARMETDAANRVASARSARRDLTRRINPP